MKQRPTSFGQCASDPIPCPIPAPSSWTASGAPSEKEVSVQQEMENAIPLQDRLVFLCRLGSGASGIMYKALDLRDMRIVAWMITCSREGRRQMVRELSALFQLLHQKKADKQNKEAVEAEAVITGRSPLAAEEGSAPTVEPRAFIVDFYDAFSNIDDGGVALMMEYMDGGSLQDIVGEGGVDENFASIAHRADWFGISSPLCATTS